MNSPMTRTSTLVVASAVSAAMLLIARSRSCRSKYQLRVRFKGSGSRAARLLVVVGPLTSHAVLGSLRAAGIDMGRWQALFYDKHHSGWRQIEVGTNQVIYCDSDSLEVELEDASISSHWQAHKCAQSAGGFFGIGIVMGKTAGNLGTLWRSAFQLGASFTCSIGARHEKLKEDTSRCWAHLPAHQYSKFEEFASSAPFGCQLVAIEMGGRDLSTFVHPQRAVYLLGAEDCGLPSSVLKACHHHISIPAARTESYNVAVAGSLVMYDRMCKQANSCNDAEAAAPASSPSSRDVHRTVAVAEGVSPSVDALVENVSDLAAWWRNEREPHEGALLLVRCSRTYKSRLLEYLPHAHACSPRASASEWLVLRTADAARALAALRSDPLLSRVLCGAYIAHELAVTVRELSEALAPLASEQTLRLSVYPRSVRAELERELPASVRLRPKGYEALLYVVQLGPQTLVWSLQPCTPGVPGPAQQTSAQQRSALQAGNLQQVNDAITEASLRMRFSIESPALLVQEVTRPATPAVLELRPPCARMAPDGKALALPPLPLPPSHDSPPIAGMDPASTGLDGATRGFATCAITIDVDHERLQTLLVGQLPKLLRQGAAVAAVVHLPREGAHGARTTGMMKQLVTDLQHAGYENIEIRWLFANGTSERTLCCQWGGNPELASERAHKIEDQGCAPAGA